MATLHAADKKTSVWMPLYIADYLADTTRLTTEQHGAYLLLIMDYWRNGALPDDDVALSNITRLSDAAWKKHRPSLARMFQVEDGEWRHKRIDTELERASANVKQRSEAGKASAEKRKKAREAKRKDQQDDNENSTSVATDVETDAQRDTQQNGKPSPSPTPTTSLRSVVERAHATGEGVPVPADLLPDRSTAASVQTLNVDPDIELGKFIAYHEAHGTLLADDKAWQAKLRKWLLDAHQFNADRNRVTDAKVQAAQHNGQTRQDAITAAADALGVGSQYLQGATHAIEN